MNEANNIIRDALTSAALYPRIRDHPLEWVRPVLAALDELEAQEKCLREQVSELVGTARSEQARARVAALEEALRQVVTVAVTSQECRDIARAALADKEGT